MMTACAKVNLNLHVTGRRGDGYHLIESVIAFADFGDEITAEENDSIVLEMSGEFAQGLDKENNLVTRAAKLLAEKFNVKQGAKIRLKKNIPVGAGLGGGSADAAATIALLCKLWRIEADEKSKLALGLALGADVPICQVGRAAFVSGIGEVIKPIENMPEFYAVMVSPGIAVSTREIFSRGVKKYSPPLKNLPEKKGEWIDFLKAQKNDLTDNAIQTVPEIKKILERISAGGHCIFARMSGSGSACFGIFPDKNSAKKIAEELTRQNKSWWIRATKINSSG